MMREILLIPFMTAETQSWMIGREYTHPYWSMWQCIITKYNKYFTAFYICCDQNPLLCRKLCLLELFAVVSERMPMFVHIFVFLLPWPWYQVCFEILFCFVYFGLTKNTFCLKDTSFFISMKSFSKDKTKQKNYTIVVAEILCLIYQIELNKYTTILEKGLKIEETLVLSIWSFRWR